VAGSSIALGLAGGGFYLAARSDIDDYDRELAEMCPSGCADDQIPTSLKEKERAGRNKSGVAIGLWSLGGALAITGGVMAILNRPRLHRERRARPLVTVSPDYIGLGVALDLD
jgi:hypothetical protein